MKEIPLTRGLVALVDDEDFEWLSALTWHALTSGKPNEYYAATRKRGVGGMNRPILVMHRMVMNPPSKDVHVDHINGNRLDNRRHNLRFATHAQNQGNKRVTWGSAGFKGVYPTRGRFKACVAGKFVGSADTAEDAAHIYDKHALAKWGEFAATNASLGLFKSANAQPPQFSATLATTPTPDESPPSPRHVGQRP